MSLISIGLLGVIYSYWVYDDNIITYGNLSLAVGIFGTLIGLYDAFDAIESIKKNKYANLKKVLLNNLIKNL